MNDSECSQKMNDARLAEQQGQLDAAALGYQQILSQRPDFSPALFCLGVLHCRHGGVATGRPMIERAISMSPDEPIFRMNFAAILMTLGETDAGILQARRAWELAPHSADAAHNLGACLFAADRFDEALIAAQAAVALAPNAWDVHANLAAIYAKLFQTDLACKSWEEVVRLNPDHFEAHTALAKAYVEQKKSNEAAPHSLKATALRPDDPLAHMLHGLVLKDQGIFDAAAASLERCIRLDPQCWEGFLLLGYVLTSLQRWPLAANAFAEVHRVQPANARGFDGLIHALRQLQAWDEVARAIETSLQSGLLVAPALAARAELHRDLQQFDLATDVAEQALKLDPQNIKAATVLACVMWDRGDYHQALELLNAWFKSHPDALLIRWYRALLRLTLGDSAGWTDYECRWELAGGTIAPPRSVTLVPQWDGSDLTGKTLLIFQEQGIGDFLQCMRALTQIASTAKQVVVLVGTPIVPVIPTLPNVIVVTTPAQVPAVDFQVGEMSFPFLLNWSPTQPPVFDSYIAEPSDELIDRWRQKLSHLKGFRIGITWTGSSSQLQNYRRLIPLQMLSCLAGIEGVTLISLQMGPKTSDIQSVDFPIFDPSLDIKTLADTAAIIRNLDLVITVDTSVAHLAGAMNAPVWTMLSRVCDFRWLLDREDSLWYSSMRLLRQKDAGDWQPVVEQIAQGVREIKSIQAEARSV